MEPDSLLRTTAQGAEWSSGRSAELYAVASWSEGYFLVNDRGHVAAQPVRGSDTQVDLFDVVRELSKRGIDFPALIRFQDVLKSRVEHLNEAFQLAISEEGYRNAYEGVYPVKVNQLREVLEEILSAGDRFGHGLECGSKSELMATLPYLADRDTLLLCNGAKDLDMTRLMLAGQRLGKRVRPILERQEEVELVLEAAREVEMTAMAGVRIRLSTRGAGLWSESGGENSKFGLSLSELVELVRRIREDHIALRLDVLHFHLGSQIADLQTLRQAVEEAARIYVWLQQNDVDVAYFDVGGGLGVAYEAGNPKALGAINYELEDYARTVVQACGRIFDEAGVPHPVLVSESGRAVTAHHSVLVVEAVGSRRKEVAPIVDRNGVEDPLLAKVFELYELASGAANVPSRADLERIFQSARSLHARMMARFRAGDLAVERKAQFERVYWATCLSIDGHLSAVDETGMSEALTALEHVLVDHYQCNFSIFRSMVDHWAIGQRFPIMPLHRLNEKPTRRAVLVDLTCDSDGQVQRFVSPSGDKRHLELHELRQGRPYLLGMFLMGAYQDIMGDMHNLFGRVTEVHVYADEAEPDNFYLEEILPGATVEQQLALVQYHANDLERRMGDLIREGVRAGRLRPREGVVLLNQYRQVFREMTYLKTNGLE